MSITDELMEYIRKHTLRWADPEHPSGGSCAFDPQTSPDMLHAIADHIDTEHKKALDELFRALTIDMRPMTDENMAADGWIRLPKDADGVPIHVHDWIVVDDEKHRVDAIATNAVYWWEEDGCHWTQSCTCCHYQPDTWEKIIEDALDADVDDFARMRDALVARCKALAGDTE